MFNTSFDSQFQSIPFYKSHPYMMPFVGDDYESLKHKKLLLIGESHYMPVGSSVHHNVNLWYGGNPVLTKPEWGNCDTRGTRIWRSGQFGREVERCLNSVMPSNGNGWHQVAFLNYFLRPTEEFIDGNGKKKIRGIEEFWKIYGGKDIDREKAIRNFIKVLEILKPDLFAFMSAKVCSFVEPEDNGDFVTYFHDYLWKWTENHNIIDYIKTNHPSQPPWNQIMPNYGKARGMTSRDFFCAWLKENWMR